jgi:tetratricopeptide (TPR) repeat protein
MHRSRPLWGLVACSGWLFCSLPNAHTRAQSEPQPPQATQTAYDGFIEQALRAYDEGRFAEARTSFRRAHDLLPTARTERTIGMCAFNLGDYVDAVSSLEAALNDPRKPLTDDQRRHASDLIARSNLHVGRFRLRLSPPDAALTVDGRTPTLIGQRELLLESGRHEIDVRATGYRSAESVLNVEGGDRTTFELRLERAAENTSAVAQTGAGESVQPEAAAERVAGVAAPNLTNRRQPEAAAGSTQKTLGYVTLGVGVAGLAAFGVVGAVAIAMQSELADHCPQARCAPAYYKDVDRYETLKTASTALLIGGGVCTALGAGLLLFRSEQSSEHATLEPMLGFGTFGLRGQL